jgi:hypothetical protein
MKQKKFLSVLLISLLNLLLNGCATPPDVVVCVELKPSKGWCTKTISAESFYVDDATLYNGKTWWDMRPDMILVPTESWVEMKTFVIKTCKNSGKCDSKISSWDRTIKEMDEKIDEKTNH